MPSREVASAWTRRAVARDEHGFAVTATIADVRRHGAHARRAGRATTARSCPASRSRRCRSRWVRTSASPATTTSSPTSRTAGSRSGSTGTTQRVGVGRAAALRRERDLDRVLRAAIDRGVERRSGRATDQRTGRRADARARSPSTSTTTSSPGVQHLALRTDDIVATVRRCGNGASGCCTCRPTTTTRRPARMAGLDVDLPWEQLAELGILVDRDDEGYLLAGVHRDGCEPSDRVHRDHPARGRARVR